MYRKLHQLAVISGCILFLSLSACTAAGTNSEPAHQPSAGTAPSQTALRIGSWNLLHLGWDNQKNFLAVAAVAAQFDLLAVQELMDPAALKHLDRKLERYTGVEWRHMASEAEGGQYYKEHYGLLWRPDRVEYTGQAVVYLDQREYFLREPYSALFQSRLTDRTIALATVHILYGDSEADRIPEIKALSRYWQWLAATYSDADLYVLTGDMNMPPGDPAWQKLDQQAKALITSGATSLSTTPGEYASLYDQIFVPDVWAQKNTYNAGIFVYPRVYDWGWGVREHVSDHLPVYLVLGDEPFTLRNFGHDIDAIMGGNASTSSCMRLNAASASRLVELPHVGPARASDIVAGRPWHSIHELVKIDGLGDQRVANIKASDALCAPVQAPN